MVIGHIWKMLLDVAEEVWDGTRTEQQEVIEQKAEFYKWVDERCQFMLQEMQTKSCKQEETTMEETTINGDIQIDSITS